MITRMRQITFVGLLVGFLLSLSLAFHLYSTPVSGFSYLTLCIQNTINIEHSIEPEITNSNDSSSHKFNNLSSSNCLVRTNFNTYLDYISSFYIPEVILIQSKLINEFNYSGLLYNLSKQSRAPPVI